MKWRTFSVREGKSIFLQWIFMLERRKPFRPFIWRRQDPEFYKLVFVGAKTTKRFNKFLGSRQKNFASLISHETSTCQKFRQPKFISILCANSILDVYGCLIWHVRNCYVCNLQLNQFVALAELREMYAKIADINSALLISGLEGGELLGGKAQHFM